MEITIAFEASAVREMLLAEPAFGVTVESALGPMLLSSSSAGWPSAAEVIRRCASKPIYWSRVSLTPAEAREVPAFFLDGANRPLPLDDLEKERVQAAFLRAYETDIEGRGGYVEEIWIRKNKKLSANETRFFYTTSLLAALRQNCEQIAGRFSGLNIGKVLGQSNLSDVAGLLCPSVRMPRVVREGARLWSESQDMNPSLDDAFPLSYSPRAIENMSDFNLTFERWTPCEGAGIVIRSCVREYWLQRKFRGVVFKPVLMAGSNLHREYTRILSEMLPAFTGRDYERPVLP